MWPLTVARLSTGLVARTCPSAAARYFVAELFLPDRLLTIQSNRSMEARPQATGRGPDRVERVGLGDWRHRPLQGCGWPIPRVTILGTNINGCPNFRVQFNFV